MKCGALGHKTRDGEPCGQDIRDESKGCIWHNPDVTDEQRLAAARSGGNAVARVHDPLIAGYKLSFETRQTVRRFAEDMTRAALQGRITPKALPGLLAGARLAIESHAQDAQDRLSQALLTLEFGGQAVELLSRLNDGLGRMRPLPPSNGSTSPTVTEEVTQEVIDSVGDAEAIVTLEAQSVRLTKHGRPDRRVFNHRQTNNAKRINGAMLDYLRNGDDNEPDEEIVEGVDYEVVKVPRKDRGNE
jgi:hypothetical protein